jgi:hypothetical protein
MSGFQKGNSCRFRLADVICPDRQQVLNQITPDLEVTGQVTLLSDAGEVPAQFAVIEVPGIAAPLIVPVAKLEAVTGTADETAGSLEERYEKIGSEKL